MSAPSETQQFLQDTVTKAQAQLAQLRDMATRNAKDASVSKQVWGQGLGRSCTTVPVSAYIPQTGSSKDPRGGGGLAARAGGAGVVAVGCAGQGEAEKMAQILMGVNICGRTANPHTGARHVTSRGRVLHSMLTTLELNSIYIFQPQTG